VRPALVLASPARAHERRMHPLPSLSPSDKGTGCLRNHHGALARPPSTTTVPPKLRPPSYSRPRPSPPTLAGSPSSLPSQKLAEKLGQGAFGSVYKVRPLPPLPRPPALADAAHPPAPPPRRVAQPGSQLCVLAPPLPPALYPQLTLNSLALAGTTGETCAVKQVRLGSPRPLARPPLRVQLVLHSDALHLLSLPRTSRD